MKIEEDGVIRTAIEKLRLANPKSRVVRLFKWEGPNYAAKWKQCVLCPWRSAAFDVFGRNFDAILEESAVHRGKHISELSKGGDSK